MLAAVALAALAVSLLLAFAFAMPPRPHPSGVAVHRAIAETRNATPPVQPPPALVDQPPPALVDQPPPLWVLLTPWAFGVDVIAMLGLAAVLIVRYNARPRRGARR